MVTPMFICKKHVWLSDNCKVMYFVLNVSEKKDVTSVSTQTSPSKNKDKIRPFPYYTDHEKSR